VKRPKLAKMLGQSAETIKSISVYVKELDHGSLGARTK
jgi:hypothetical protein